MYNIPNMYIQLKELAQTSAEIPEIEERVGDLEDQVEDLDVQINGDSTAEPPVPGIVDELEAIETTLYGDETAQPPVPGLNDRVEDLEEYHTGKVVATVTADGVKTNSALLDELYALLPDLRTLTHTVLRSANADLTSIMDLPVNYISDNIRYGGIRNNGTGLRIVSARLLASGSNYNQIDFNNQAVASYTNNEQTVPDSGSIFSIIQY